MMVRKYLTCNRHSVFIAAVFLLHICTSFPNVSTRNGSSNPSLANTDVVDPRRHPDEVRMEGKKMYERMIVFLEQAQSIWPLASSWLRGLRKWFDDTNTSRVSFESGTMTDGVSPYSLRFLSTSCA